MIRKTLIAATLPLLFFCATALAAGEKCQADFPEGSTVVLKATACPGSVFAGWTGACEGSGEYCVVTMDEAKSVTATFIEVPSPLHLRLTKADIVFWVNKCAPWTHKWDHWLIKRL